LPIWLRHSLKYFRCIRVFLHPINAGVNHVPTKAVATTPINVATYSGGIGAGTATKFAVNLPNLVILSLASGLSGFICKKNSKMESKRDGGDESFIY